MKKILVTGSNGFIGKNLVEQLQEDYLIKAPRREELNLLDGTMVKDYLKREKFDVIIHGANQNNTRNKITTPYDSLNCNLTMFFNLERCQPYFGKMYYFGSGAEYDAKHYIPDMTEDYFDTYVPTEPYGFSKYIMSKSCNQKNNIIDLRLFGVFGKYEEWERRFISNNICKNLKDLPMTLYQNMYFDYLYIDDLINIMRWFIENTPKHKHYNVCRGKKIDLKSLAFSINKVMKTNTRLLIEKEGWKAEYTGNNRRLLEEMGNYNFTSMDEDIKYMVNFYTKELKTIEISKLL